MRCERFVKDYLPGVKAEIVKKLYSEHELKQVDIADIMGTTQPAVSQYIKGERGEQKELTREVIEETCDVADEIYEDFECDEWSTEKIDKMMCRICKKV